MEKTKKEKLGKDGKPFDINRYVEWAESSIPSKIQFPDKMRNGSTGANSRFIKRIFCPYCFEGIKGGPRALNKHKTICLKKPD